MRCCIFSVEASLLAKGSPHIDLWLPGTPAHSSNVVDTSVTFYILAFEDCNCAYVGTGYQQHPPRNFGSRESWFL